MAKKIREEDALAYHSQGRPGKIEVIPTTATETQRDLALAYSPGVAKPCLRIADNQDINILPKEISWQLFQMEQQYSD